MIEDLSERFESCADPPDASAVSRAEEDDDAFLCEKESEEEEEEWT